MNIEQIKTMVAEAISLRGLAQVDVETAKAEADGAVKACMAKIATAFVGFNGDDDTMRGLIREGWFVYVTGRGLTKKDGTPYAAASEMPAPTCSDYATFAKAGQRGAFTAVDAVASAVSGKWYQNARDLVRAHLNDGAPINGATMEAIVQRRDAKAGDVNRALDGVVKTLKRLAKDHSLDTTAAQKALEALKTAPPAPKATVTVLAPAKAPKAVQQAPQAVAAAPIDISQLLGQLVSMPQFQQTLAAYMPATTTKPSRKK